MGQEWVSAEHPEPRACARKDLSCWVGSHGSLCLATDFPCDVGTSFSSLLLLVPCVKSRYCVTLPHQGAVNMVSFQFEEAPVVGHPSSFKKFSLEQMIFGTSAWPHYLGGSPW